MLDWLKPKSGSPKRRGRSTDRRAGPRQGLYVAKQPRARTQSGTWRRKRSDAGTKRGPRSKRLFG